MTKTPQWLPDGSGIDPLTIDQKTVVEVEWLSGNRRLRYGDEGGYQIVAGEVGKCTPSPWDGVRVVRVFADVTPPKPDLRVEVVARVLHRADPSHDLTCEDQDWVHWREDASDVLDALDAIGTAPDERRGR